MLVSLLKVSYFLQYGISDCWQILDFLWSEIYILQRHLLLQTYNGMEAGFQSGDYLQQQFNPCTYVCIFNVYLHGLHM